jgi:hypothetical protein
MTRFGPETPAPPPAEVEAEDTRDSLFERWLAHSTASQPRLRRSRVPAPSAPENPPLGDELADRWFK